MKTLVITNDYSPKKGGISTYIQSFCKNLNFETYIYAPNWAEGENVINSKKPFLGICVGMQLLADISYENGEHYGLGWIKGSIEKLKVNNLKLPHMGWNNVKIINNSFKMKFPSENKDFY